MLRRLTGACYALRREPKGDRILPIGVTGAARESAKRATAQKRALESAGFTVSTVSGDLPIGWTGSVTLVRREVNEDPFGINVCSALEAVGLDAMTVRPVFCGLGATKLSSKISLGRLRSLGDDGYPRIDVVINAIRF
jgi:hypothetical protein